MIIKVVTLLLISLVTLSPPALEVVSPEDFVDNTLSQDAHDQIRELNLRASGTRNLEDLKDLPSLVSLDITNQKNPEEEHILDASQLNTVTDLAPLLGAQALKSLNVNYLFLPRKTSLTVQNRLTRPMQRPLAPSRRTKPQWTFTSTGVFIVFFTCATWSV